MKYNLDNYVPKGNIEDFPLEIIEKMLEYQEAQGNTPDVTVFEYDRWSAMTEGGFTWSKTVEGVWFWDDIIDYRKFDLFFEKYPKK